MALERASRNPESKVSKPPAGPLKGAAISFLRWLRDPGAPALRPPLMWVAVVATTSFLILFATPIFHTQVDPVFQWVALGTALLFIALRILLATPVLRWLGSLAPSFVAAPSKVDRYSEAIDPGKLVVRYMTAFIRSGFVASTTLTLRALTSPATIVVRVSEHHRAGRERSTISATRTVAGQKNLMLLPVYRTRKGLTVGSLQVEVDDKRARTLRTDESKGLLLLQLASLFSDVTGSARGDLIDDLQKRIVGREESTPSEVAERLNAIALLPRTRVASEKNIEALKSFVRIVLTNDVIFAVMPDGSGAGTRVKISYSLPYSKGTSGMSERFKRAVGIQISRYFADIRSAADSPSYHLQIDGPQGMYVDHRVFDMVAYPENDEKSDAATPDSDYPRDVWMDTGYLVGDESLHLYMRDFDGRPLVGETGVPKSNPVPYLKVTFAETPPGILGPTAAVAL